MRQAIELVLALLAGAAFGVICMCFAMMAKLGDAAEERREREFIQRTFIERQGVRIEIEETVDRRGGMSRPPLYLVEDESP